MTRFVKISTLRLEFVFCSDLTGAGRRNKAASSCSAQPGLGHLHSGAAVAADESPQNVSKVSHRLCHYLKLR